MQKGGSTMTNILNWLVPFIICINGILMILSEVVDWKKLGEKFRNEPSSELPEEYKKIQNEWKT